MIQTLTSLGHQVEEISPMIGISWEAFVAMNTKFWASNTASWIDAISAQTGRSIDHEHLEPATLALYQYGKQMSATDFLGALYERNIVTRKVGHLFEEFDCMLSPTLSDLAPEIGTYNASQNQLDGHGWMNWVFEQSPFTALANIAGIPAMSVPCGQDADTHLPIGMQFMGKNGQEASLLALAAQLEMVMPWIHQKPRNWVAH
ncbi:amidase family protein [Acinetobacter sichuanensis]|uniref:amidase family protein n=1 Tax=Acinetobacter sichuanensis TaxID=2136183 RepID=UPI00280F1293|nr:amidase family protein [Acinetobacter sichuanensis]MDQ9021857.1 amidase family protein [Acinetobacter sichuanensis]